MSIKKAVLIIFILFSVVSVSFYSTPKVEAQNRADYLLPFRYDENWQTDGDYGIHADSTGLGIDFYARDSRKNEVLSPGYGYLTRGCTVNGATYLILDTVQGHRFRFVHMIADTVPIDPGQRLFVNRGEIIGQVTGVGDFEEPGCVMSSDGPHIHFSWKREDCENISFQDFVFDCGGLYFCDGIGVYNTYCNRKYLNTRFISRNIPYFEGCREKVVNAQPEYNYEDSIHLQKCLISLELLDSQYQTGFYGPLTTEGVKYAKEIVDLSTKCGYYVNDGYQYGTTSNSIVKLQECLISFGLLEEGLNTGYFGDKTDAALEGYFKLRIVVEQDRVL